MDYCTAGPQYASGGFIADSTLPFVISGSQQQFLVRNSSVAGWSNSVWNQVFAGRAGRPRRRTSPVGRTSTRRSTPPRPRKEKPYLYVDAAGKYNVFVPSAQTNTPGTTWANGQHARHGRSR